MEAEINILTVVQHKGSPSRPIKFIPIILLFRAVNCRPTVLASMLLLTTSFCI